MHTMVAIALPAVVAFDLATAAQVFGHVDERDFYRFEVVTPADVPICSTTGFHITPTAPLRSVAAAHTVIVPGFEPLDTPGGPVLDALRDAASGGVRVVSICTGAFALAEAGLLDGRPATTHWRDADQFRARFPAVDLRSDVLYVDDGNVLTSAGVAAGIDLCLHVAGVDRGSPAALRIARRMVTAPHRAGGQRQYRPESAPLARLGLVASACEWAEQRIRQPISAEDLARAVNSSPRNLRRRFQLELGLSPMAWVGQARVQRARVLLESTDLPIEQLAHAAGFASGARLRAAFAAHTGMTPHQYRDTRRGP